MYGSDLIRCDFHPFVVDQMRGCSCGSSYCLVMNDVMKYDVINLVVVYLFFQTRL